MSDRVDATAILLAAGLGTRMRSHLPKALHALAGRPMLRHLIDAAEAVFQRVVVVVGPGMEALEAVAAPHPVVVQHDRLGTAHAALQAAGLFGHGDVAVLYADNPLVTVETLRRLVARRAGPGTDLALLAMRPADPARYGRLITEPDGEGGERVLRIVEWAEADAAERAIGLCNAGVLCAEAERFAGWLRRVENNNAKGEFYLTDVVALAAADGARVRHVEAPEEELRGVNSKAELAEAEAVIQRRLRRAAMEAGVTLLAPDTVFLQADTVIGADTVVHPNVVFGPNVVVGSGAEIRSFSHLEGAVVGDRALVGPFARLRPGADVGASAHVGNFVELKNATLGEGAKANHFTYLGDASVGARTNIGAGTITCNYDGVNKHRTVLGADVFIGSNATLVAPVTIGDRAFVAAGSTITDPVGENDLAFGRARQANKAGGAEALRARIKQGKN
ncbi:bifunctional UDP-N-acetylglucosamine diphosphorylase/glucosamine-1-phosphate N-acetyltransferase GlmU [Acetobacteraceae bacterium KSS8]|uniref:Bifunctional protein GlmU n=1 Tax=Endosaccharibacter trunci TaxID=2812733 RepID=A0ABT1W7T6_9PROT|nr:bifunctional UDP-N-acetylglucosamine diphosphorylase/glucosamine-1-phosphate N-acetyltransferase GlmU [Acetobacteraceae bacterium KSS8]